MGSRDDAALDTFLREIAEARSESEALDTLDAIVGPVSPQPSLRDRLLASLETSGRWHRFADPVSELLGVSVHRAKQLLDGVDEPSSWNPGMLPGMELYHLEGDDAVDNAITGFIRFPGGVPVPDHDHLGEEIMLVLSGRYIDSGGHEWGPGDVARMPAGSSHNFQILPGPDLLYLVIVHEGLRIAGMLLRPGDPRI
jgi:anti-sigma factor ChrR (cupin superfamily)